MAASSGKILLVEGQDDLYAIVRLMAEHTHWGNKKAEWPVDVKVCEGVEKLIKPTDLTVRFKSRDVNIIGIVIDADDKFKARWDDLRKACHGFSTDLPVDFPMEGLIADGNDGKRLGVWIMPDNASRGMLETFMYYLVPEAQTPLWKTACDAAASARGAGAPYKDCHRDKVNIHTWLAWQDPPGQGLGSAITQKILDPKAESAKNFVDWFCKLYDLVPKET